ncbi:VOC family protein [Nocardia alni]|uniref:VOC family protein n=1 Tax=Nocardia alni TaxID=2815723 RepID=UPI001C23B1CB|nr:VOC family protein [Nocardia alni]
MSNGIRLRHVAVVTADLDKSVDIVHRALRLPEPFNDDLANQFATHNAVFALGNSFLEICTPYDDGPVRRYAEKHGGDAGYMAVFQVRDNAAALTRLDELGVRVIAELKLFDQGANMLHPKDVPGAMVSFDWAEPYGSWRWGGPAWSGRVPEHPAGGITRLEVRAVEPRDSAEKWGRVLESEPRDVGAGEFVVEIADAGQEIRFTPAPDRNAEGIVGVELELPDQLVRERKFSVGGVDFAVTGVLTPAHP